LLKKIEGHGTDRYLCTQMKLKAVTQNKNHAQTISFDIVRANVNSRNGFSSQGLTKLGKISISIFKDKMDGNSAI
jgi:hypothetical protein